MKLSFFWESFMIMIGGINSKPLHSWGLQNLQYIAFYRSKLLWNHSSVLTGQFLASSSILLLLNNWIQCVCLVNAMFLATALHPLIWYWVLRPRHCMSHMLCNRYNIRGHLAQRKLKMFFSGNGKNHQRINRQRSEYFKESSAPRLQDILQDRQDYH